MKSKDVLILQYLLEHKNERLSIRSIASAIKMDYKNTHSIIKRLEAERVLQLEPFGQSLSVEIIPTAHPLIFEAEYNRQKTMLRDKNLKVALADIKKAVKSAFCIILLFGSYAKNKQTKNSDMDLMIIIPDGNEELVEKSMHRTIGSIPLPIHQIVFSERQFREMLNSREPNVGQEASKNNIILYGIEQYYELTR